MPRIAGGHVGVQHRVAAHVRFVEDAVHPGHVRRPVVAPHERGVDDDRLRHPARVVAAVEAEVAAMRADAVAVVRVAPAQRSGQRLGVRVDQQLVVVEAVAVRRIVGTVDAIAVERSRPQTRQVAVPHFVGVFGQRVARDLAPAARVEDAQVDALGVRREEREVDAGTVPGRAERIGAARSRGVSGSALRGEDDRGERRQRQRERVLAAVHHHRFCMGEAQVALRFRRRRWPHRC